MLLHGPFVSTIIAIVYRRYEGLVPAAPVSKFDRVAHAVKFDTRDSALDVGADVGTNKCWHMLALVGTQRNESVQSVPSVVAVARRGHVKATARFAVGVHARGCLWCRG